MVRHYCILDDLGRELVNRSLDKAAAMAAACRMSDNELTNILWDSLQEAINDEINRSILAALRGEEKPYVPEPLPSPGDLWIVRYEDGTYGARGFGTEYQRFMDERRGMIQWSGYDFPWAYFTLAEGVAHDLLVASFEQHFSDYPGLE